MSIRIESRDGGYEQYPEKSDIDVVKTVNHLIEDRGYTADQVRRYANQHLSKYPELLKEALSVVGTGATQNIPKPSGTSMDPSPVTIESPDIEIPSVAFGPASPSVSAPDPVHTSDPTPERTTESRGDPSVTPSLGPISMSAPAGDVEQDQLFSDAYKIAKSDLYARELEAEELVSNQSRSPSSLDVWTAAFVNHNSLSSAIVNEPTGHIRPVEGYSPFTKDSDGKTDIDGYENFWSAFKLSGSPEETRVIKSQIDRETRNQKLLSEGGAEGVVASIAAGVVDPINMLSVFVPGFRENALYRAIFTGVVGAAGTEAVLQSTQETRSIEETAINIAASAVLSGVMQGVSDTTVNLVTRGQRELLQEQVARNVGAAQTDPIQLMGSGAELQKGPLSYIARQMAKITPLGRAIQSNESMVRSTVQDMAETNMRVEGDFVPTAVESLIKLDYSKLAQTEIAVRKLQKQWKAANGSDDLGFNIALSNALRSGDTAGDPVLQQAVDQVRASIDDLWNRAAQARVPGTFRELEDGTVEPIKTSTADSYLTRRYDLNVVRADPEGHKRAWMRGLRDQHQREYQDSLAEYEAEVKRLNEEWEAKKAKAGAKFDSDIAKELEARRAEAGEPEPAAAPPRDWDAELKTVQDDIDEIIDDPFNYDDMGELTRQAQRKLDRAMDRQSKLEQQKAAAPDETPDVRSQAADDVRDYDAAREAYINRKVSKPRMPPKPTMREMDDAELREVATNIHNKIVHLREGDLHFNTGPSGAAMLKTRANVRDEFLNDYLVKDWEGLLQGYYKSLAPKVRLAERFGEGEDGFMMKNRLDDIQLAYEQKISAKEQAMDQAATPKERKALQKERDSLVRQMQSEVRDVEVMRDRLLNITQEASWMNPENRGVLSALRAARSWNVATMLSNVVVASAPDLARVMTYNGGLKFIKAFAKSFNKTLVRSNLPKDQMAKMASAMDRAMNYRLGQLTEVEDGIIYTRADKYAHWVADKSMTLAGIKHWNSLQKTISGHLVADKIGEHLAKGTGRAELKRLGLTDEMYDMARQRYREFGSVEDGMHNLGLERWREVELVEAIEAAAIKEVDSLIVTPGVGDKPLLMTTELGRTIGQFKSFMIASTNRMLLPLLQEKGIRPWIEIMTGIGIGASIYQMRQLAAGKEIEEDPDQLLLHAVDSTGLPAYAIEMMKMGQAATGVDMLGLEEDAKYYSRGPWGTLLGPSVQQAQNVWKSVYGLGSDVEGEPSPESKAKAMVNLMPMQNHYVLKNGYDKIEEAISKTLD